MERFVRVALAVLALVMVSGVCSAQAQKFISEKGLDQGGLELVKTIALLEVPDPRYYRFGEGSGGLTFMFGVVGSLMEQSNYGSDTAEYGDFSFGKTSQAFLKQFLEENNYRVIEYPVDRKNKFGLVKDYTTLNIEGVDAYLDVAPVDVGYMQNEANIFSNRTGPHVSVVVRLVSSATNEVIYAGSAQYGWNMNPLVSGIKIESPEDHQYESHEELKAQKVQAIERLIRGIEAVSLNIAKKVTKGTFVSEMSLTMEDVMGDDGSQASIEFIGKAATEIALKTYDEKLWKQAGKLAEGDVEKQSGIYIKLRSKQLYQFPFWLKKKRERNIKN